MAASSALLSQLRGMYWEGTGRQLCAWWTALNDSLSVPKMSTTLDERQPAHPNPLQRHSRQCGEQCTKMRASTCQRSRQHTAGCFRGPWMVTTAQPRRLLWLPMAVHEALARQLRPRAIDCGHSGHVSALNSCMHIAMRKRESNREVSWPEKRQGSRGAVWHRGRRMIGMSSGGRLRSSRRSFRPLSCIVGGHDSP